MSIFSTKLNQKLAKNCYLCSLQSDIEQKKQIFLSEIAVDLERKNAEIDKL